VPAIAGIAGIVDTLAAMPRGRLITIEGLDGAGKSTLAEALADRLGARLLREPGGVDLSERIRTLVKDPGLQVSPRAEALLYAAARAQLVEELVEPLLEAGTTVVLDRFVDSSLAYQGGGRGLGLDAVGAVNRFATGGLSPDVTLLLRVDIATGRMRLGGRGEVPDRLEREDAAFFERVQSVYDQLADQPQVRVIDASGSPEEVLEEALRAVSET
jgi:dTMP kinase